MGMALKARPVACNIALRMAGAGGQAGGSPRALVPKGLVGSAFSQKRASMRGWSIKVSSL